MKTIISNATMGYTASTITTTGDCTVVGWIAQNKVVEHSAIAAQYSGNQCKVTEGEMVTISGNRNAAISKQA